MIIIFLVVLSNGSYHRYVKVDSDKAKKEEKEKQDQELHRIQ